MRWVLALAIAGASATATAQPLARPPDAVSPPSPPGVEGMPELKTDCAEAELFGGTVVERSGLCWARQGEWVSVRTLGQRAFIADPTSFRAHYLLGLAHHFGEANLPKSLFHLSRAESLIDERFGPGLADTPEALLVYQRTLLEQVYVLGEMDDHVGKLEAIERLRERSDLDYAVLAAWPLMKLGRFSEARTIAQAHLQHEDEFFRVVARTALCAIESEQHFRMRAYEACVAAAEPYRNRITDGAVELTNAGAASEEVHRFSEAERYFREATRRHPEGSVNPWGRLVQLYLRQARYSDALAAWRRMAAYRDARPGRHLRQQDDAEAAMVGSAVLLLAGRTDIAAEYTKTIVDRPDRKGTSSAAAEQSEAGAALIDMIVHTTRGRRLTEQASYAGWLEAVQLRARAVAAHYRAWESGRRVLKVLSSEDRLVLTLRPEAPGSIEGPVWIDPEVVGLVGSGVAQAAIDRAREDETLPPDLAEPIFALLEAEAHFVARRWSRAEERARSARRGLSAGDALLGARARIIEGRAAEAQGDHEVALARFAEVLGTDPGLFRRLGLALPVEVVRIEDSASVRELARAVGGSPRFAERSWGFVLDLSASGAVLRDRAGSLIRTISWPGDQTDPVPADVLHHRLFAPEADLAQTDLDSLDSVIGSGMGLDPAIDRILKPAR